jgi:hypothetical protein
MAAMDLHRLAEERSVAYHRVIAARLRERPEILREARQRVAGWLATSGQPPWRATQWAAILDLELPAIESFLTERSELADELRQSSPFAGALSPRERWQIWRETRERLSPQP